VSQRKGHKDFLTVVCDIERSCLLEVIDSHKQADIIAVLSQQALAVRLQVEEVSIDMWGGFLKVVTEVFPNAKIVYDRFHVMQPVNKELNKVRRQVGVTVKGGKFILLKNGKDLTEEEQQKLALMLRRSPRLKLAYELKEAFRAIFEADHGVEQSKALLLQWVKQARPVYHEVLNTIQTHLDGICNYFCNRTTSGVMEGINNRIKLIKRQAYGFVNFDNFRTRLLACLAN
jgi:transposase